MSEQANAAPIIIKRKKVVAGGGHHGGAWKVACADFVTAMMAFFMLMWLLNATTEQQRKGIADYFTPTIPINRVSGGGDGAFGGDSIFSENALPQSGTGGLDTPPAPLENLPGNSFSDDELRAAEDMLFGGGGESLIMENAMRHVTTRLTDEGLVIELFEREEALLFDGPNDEPTQLLRDLTALISDVAKTVTNGIAIGGHVRANAIVIVDNPVWSRSYSRATTTRQLLEQAGTDPMRMARVTGHADREPVVPNRMSRRNNRVEVVLLRSDDNF